MPTPLPELAGPSLLDSLLFESVFLGPVLGLLIAAALYIAFTKAEKGRQATVLALVALAIGAGLAVSSSLVETQRERAVRLTGDLIDRVFVGDVSGSDLLIASSVRVAAAGQEIRNSGKPWMLGVIGQVPDWLDSGSFSIQGSQDDNETTTRVLARVSIEPNWSLGPSSWMFTWRREFDGSWKLYNLEALRFGLRDADARSLERGRP